MRSNHRMPASRFPGEVSANMTSREMHRNLRPDKTNFSSSERNARQCRSRIFIKAAPALPRRNSAHNCRRIRWRSLSILLPIPADRAAQRNASQSARPFGEASVLPDSHAAIRSETAPRLEAHAAMGIWRHRLPDRRLKRGAARECSSSGRTNCRLRIFCRSTTTFTARKPISRRSARWFICTAARHLPTAMDIQKAGLSPGKSAICHYPSQQDAAMLWYHDHALGINRLNVFAGTAGRVLRAGRI